MALPRLLRPNPSLSTLRHYQPPHPRLLLHSSIIPLISSSSSSSKTHLLQIHAHLLRTSLLFHDISISSAFLSRAAAHSASYSLRLFDQIPRPTIFHCNAMLRALSESASPEQTLVFFKRMQDLGVRGNPFSSSFVLKACVRTSSFSLGKQVHGRILRRGHHSDSLLLTNLIGIYDSCGSASDARKVFDEMAEKDTVAWNVLISCYARNRRTKDALHLFDEMRDPKYGAEPDDVTCLLLLQACANLGALDFGERIREFAEEHGYIDALNVRNSLIAMYSKCGCANKAYRVFCDMPQKNVVSWSAMISGLAVNGFGRDAIEAFREMLNVGVAPDEQTFTGVLSACSHSGLVEEGLRFFDMMKFEYGLVPNVCHYGCIVDLMGRAGLLDRAYGLIVREMGVTPDATIWRTLLGACRIHGHVDLGERVISHLIELKAQQAGDYVLLLNIYASAGKWEKVAEVRRLMKDKGIQTTPGCSSIEVSGEVHEFVADDDLHPRKAEIYEKLEEICKQLKIAGYVADVASELHDLDMEGKESALSYHSEKLAIAFGVLVTPPGRTLRIAKNLRICADCHNFMKVFSGVYNRPVIVRDRSRFHHFKEGHCSCNDYW
ncbi:pentatricopeptide repeat-containing protein At3g47530 [Ananas comosus]|uniref:Pentatricopeptide repeat-containing protein At3g47530 n=1 Tax=Ananas comosus TaxID=4615 RepID=A0A6P5GMA5_ANACO|nr:pentatricopeptide repeat-containing protein At3g47530 [Ananas comosus]